MIDNYPEGQTEELEVDNNMENPELGKRVVPFGREVYIEREDFMEEPPDHTYNVPLLLFHLRLSQIRYRLRNMHSSDVLRCPETARTEEKYVEPFTGYPQQMQ